MRSKMWLIIQIETETGKNLFAVFFFLIIVVCCRYFKAAFKKKLSKLDFRVRWESSDDTTFERHAYCILGWCSFFLNHFFQLLFEAKLFVCDFFSLSMTFQWFYCIRAAINTAIKCNIFLRLKNHLDVTRRIFRIQLIFHLFWYIQSYIHCIVIKLYPNTTGTSKINTNATNSIYDKPHWRRYWRRLQIVNKKTVLPQL